MATDPSHSPSSQTSTVSTIETIDVELVSKKRDEIQELFQEKFVFIPEDYYARMAQTGLLAQLVKLIENENETHEHIKQQLKRFNIYIPSCYYNGMIENELIEPFIELINDVKHEQQVTRLQALERIHQCKRRYEDEDDDNISDKTKRRKIEQVDVSTQTIIDGDHDFISILRDKDNSEHNQSKQVS